MSTAKAHAAPSGRICEKCPSTSGEFQANAFFFIDDLWGEVLVYMKETKDIISAINNSIFQPLFMAAILKKKLLNALLSAKKLHTIIALFNDELSTEISAAYVNTIHFVILLTVLTIREGFL